MAPFDRLHTSSY